MTLETDVEARARKRATIAQAWWKVVAQESTAGPSKMTVETCALWVAAAEVGTPSPEG